jgi:hypothetical protein
MKYPLYACLEDDNSEPWSVEYSGWAKHNPISANVRSKGISLRGTLHICCRHSGLHQLSSCRLVSSAPKEATQFSLDWVQVGWGMNRLKPVHILVQCADLLLNRLQLTPGMPVAKLTDSCHLFQDPDLASRSLTRKAIY